MCGRFARTSSREVVAQELGVARFVNVDLRPRYNIAPSQTVEAIIRDGAEKRLGPMRWGFSTSSPKERKLAPINARAETIATTPMFREAFRRRRCLIVADGFYEWQTNGRGKRRTSFTCVRGGHSASLAYGPLSAKRLGRGLRRVPS
jgi:putative SOS response-associated peptidase YedK